VRSLLLVPVSIAWATLEQGSIVFELVAVLLAGLIVLELAEAKGWELPSWLPAGLGGSRPTTADALPEDTEA
jgi:hypothetical protein